MRVSLREGCSVCQVNMFSLLYVSVCATDDRADKEGDVREKVVGHGLWRMGSEDAIHVCSIGRRRVRGEADGSGGG